MSNKSLNDYVTVHKWLFTLRTYCFNTFINKYNKDITYLEWDWKSLIPKEELKKQLSQEKEQKDKYKFI